MTHHDAIILTTFWRHTYASITW